MKTYSELESSISSWRLLLAFKQELRDLVENLDAVNN
jgi:hypothetical protein